MPENMEDFYCAHYTETAKKYGHDEAWVEEQVKEGLKRNAEYQREREEKERREFPGKPAWLAHKLMEVVSCSTARYEDLPERSPLSEVTDIEWRQALAIIQKRREQNAARTVDRFVFSNKAKIAHREMTYVLRHHEYAPLDRLPYYAKLLRKAERNYTAIADAFEAERARIKEVGA